MKHLVITFVIICPQLSFAVDNSHPEIYLENESILSHQEGGTYSEPKYTGDDGNKLSASFEALSSINSFDIQYHNKMDNFEQSWWALQFKATTAPYSSLADELVSSSGHVDSDANFTRNANNQSITMGGIGLSYRFKLLTQFNDSERFFEHISAFVNYAIATDSTNTSRAYTGFGQNTDYSFIYRGTGSFYYGLKFSYNTVTVSRIAISTEKKPDRSLVYSWANVGLELGYYY